MKCHKCGKKIGKLDYHFIPGKTDNGYRICIECAKAKDIISLI